MYFLHIIFLVYLFARLYQFVLKELLVESTKKKKEVKVVQYSRIKHNACAEKVLRRKETKSDALVMNQIKS